MGFRDEYDQWIKTEDGKRIHCREHLHIHFTETLLGIMFNNEKSRRMVADRSNMSTDEFNEMLRGDKSPTLKEVSDLFAVMGYRCEITAEKLED